MRAHPSLVLVLVLAAHACTNAPSPMIATDQLAAPVAQKRPHAITAHGHTRNDEYHWMRLSEEQRNAAEPDSLTRAVIDHLNAENAYTEGVLAPVKQLREDLFKEMKARIKEEDLSVPYRENGYWYQQRYDTGKEYPIHLRAAAKGDTWPAENDAAWSVIIDENRLAEGAAYFDLGDFEISPGNGLAAYSTDRVGRRIYDIGFRDLATGNDLPDVIEATAGGCAFADDRTVFYSRKDSTLRSYRIYRHVIGTDPANDALVFEEKDPAFSCDVFRSRSNRFVMISSGSTLSDEHLFLPVDEPMGQFRAFLKREEEHEHSVQHVPGTNGAPGKWLIVTNWKALNFRLMECGERETGDKSKWKEVIAHRADVLLEDAEPFRDHIVITERREGLTHLRVRRLSTNSEHEITFNDPAYVAYGGTNPEWDTHLFRYSYTSLTTPSSVYQHDLLTQQSTLLKQQEVIGAFKAEDYASERIWAPARDGAQVPVSIVYRKGTPIDGTSPMLLYGYGSYGYSIDPTFSSARLSLLDRGFVFAIAHIRGGEEMGREWYENGKMEHKLNTFTDFIDCADYLVAKKYADPERVFCHGGSAGGLLVGAVVNMRPDRWKAVCAEVPFVDVVTTMLDESIPLTTGEFDEWGDPKEKAAYERMLSYSPYDNITDARYPAMLVTTGFHDSQVQYWEPAKWVQRLREHQKAIEPVLLHTNMEAGHGGASGRFERLKEVALVYAFFLRQAGLAG
jgi:oligopeptidase B